MPIKGREKGQFWLTVSSNLSGLAWCEPKPSGKDGPSVHHRVGPKAEVVAPFQKQGKFAPWEHAMKPPRRKFLHLAARAAGPFAYHVGASYATRRLVSCWRDSSGGPYPNLAYKPDADFEPIDIVIEQPILVLATEDFPADNLKEFVAWPPHLMNACFNLPIFDTAFVCTVLNLGGLGPS